MAEQKEDERPTVLVGCRIPNGVELHVMKRVEHNATIADLGSAVPTGLRDLGIIKLSGPTFGKPAAEGFTPVDKELWDVWIAENENNPLVQGGSIFVDAPDEDTKDESGEDKTEGEADKDEKDDSAPLRGGPVKTGDSPAVADPAPSTAAKAKPAAEPAPKA